MDVTKEQFLAQWGSRPLGEIRKAFIEQTKREPSGKTKSEVLDECWAAMSGEEAPEPLPVAPPPPHPEGLRYEARFFGNDPNLQSAYRRGGVVLTRQWQPISVSEAQLAELRADSKRVQLRLV